MDSEFDDKYFELSQLDRKGERRRKRSKRIRRWEMERGKEETRKGGISSGRRSRQGEKTIKLKCMIYEAILNEQIFASLKILVMQYISNVNFCDEGNLSGFEI